MCPSGVAPTDATATVWEYDYIMWQDGHGSAGPVYSKIQLLYYRAAYQVTPAIRQCSFISARSGPTPWHGSWTLSSLTSAEMRLDFHFLGDESRLRWARVMKRPNGVWYGQDYRGRDVDLILIKTYDLLHNGWVERAQ